MHIHYLSVGLMLSSFWNMQQIVLFQCEQLRLTLRWIVPNSWYLFYSFFPPPPSIFNSDFLVLKGFCSLILETFWKLPAVFAVWDIKGLQVGKMMIYSQLKLLVCTVFKMMPKIIG